MPSKQQPCVHYWLIEDNQRPTSQGVCKYCGAKAMFSNSMAIAKFNPGGRELSKYKAELKRLKLAKEA
jgi:hypothetical protein